MQQGWRMSSCSLISPFPYTLSSLHRLYPLGNHLNKSLNSILQCPVTLSFQDTHSLNPNSEGKAVMHCTLLSCVAKARLEQRIALVTTQFSLFNLRWVLNNLFFSLGQLFLLSSQLTSHQTNLNRGEAGNIIHFIKIPPLNAYLFNILYDKMRNTHKAFALHTEEQGLSPGKALVWLNGKINKLKSFFKEHHFHLKE